MNIDINEVLSDMLAAIKGEVKDNWRLVKGTANTFLQSRKERLELLVSLRVENEISERFFLKRLKDEEKILESELHAIAVISKAIAQRAANAAIEVLEKAVTKVLSL